MCFLLGMLESKIVDGNGFLHSIMIHGWVVNIDASFDVPRALDPTLDASRALWFLFIALQTNSD